MPEFKQITEGIFTVRDFFTPSECRAHIERAVASGFQIAPIDSVLGTTVMPEVRNNERVMIDDPTVADELWTHSKDFVPKYRGAESWEACGVNERLRYYRYNIGQQFDWHHDGYFRRNANERSHLTFMVYLNDEFEGGETAFDDLLIVPQQGMALFFLHELLHKGEKVTAGTKFVLRTDVMYRTTPNVQPKSSSP